MDIAEQDLKSPLASHLNSISKLRNSSHATFSDYEPDVNTPGIIDSTVAETTFLRTIPNLTMHDPELVEMAQKLLDAYELRDKYINISLQNESDNPKNQDTWEIYPSPPPPGSKVYPHTMTQASKSHSGMQQTIVCEFDCSNIDTPGESNLIFQIDEFGVYSLYDDSGETNSTNMISEHPSIYEYYKDLNSLIELNLDGPARSMTYKRLKYIELEFQMYLHLSESLEKKETIDVSHRDFYNVRKVDTHVHLASCMNQKHLLRFIKHKMKTEQNKLVMFRDNQWLSLNQVFESLKLTAYDLSIDTLDMHAHKDSFHRFDKFNTKYNPIGESRLRAIFLKTDNHIDGLYFAQLTKEVCYDLESSKYQMAEYRVSIYGHSPDEWEKLASWIVDHKVVSHNVRWLIQVPRLYSIYKESGKVSNFQELLINIFKPVFEASKNPQKYPKLHAFLQRVVGFDSVDDESKAEKQPGSNITLPINWNKKENPPYSYYCYYMFANICTLNQFRQKRRLNTFVFRPHAGEAGDINHLAAAYLTSQSIAHGILLRKTPVLQYLFYLKQIGIAMSPLSNNALFLTYSRNPFINYFNRGLNVSLSTDDPLQFHYTKEPLIEEYSIAAQIYRLSNVDMCEIALNSVKQSGFEAHLKKHWIGHDYLESKFDVNKTNVPSIRFNHRNKILCQEKQMLDNMATSKPNLRSKPTS